jgi:excisionase family DNA binding protein
MKDEERQVERTVETPRKWLSVDEMAQVLGLSKMTLYREIAAGHLAAVRVGRRLLFPADLLDRMSEAAISSGREVSAKEFGGGSS